MSIFVLLGIFIVSLFVMAGMIVHQNRNMTKGLATLPPQVGLTGVSSRIFSGAHDLEQATMVLFGAVFMRIKAHTQTGMRKATHFVAHKTPIKGISNAISGKKEVPVGGAAPSTYLKDMTDHRNQTRENGSRE